MTKNSRAPQAFVIEDKAHKPHKKLHVEFAVEPAQLIPVIAPHMPVEKTARGFRWGFVLLSTLLSLFSLWSILTVSQIIEGYFVRSALLGWIAFIIACIAGVAALALTMREIWGLLRLRRIEKLQLLAAHALNQDDEASAHQAISGLIALYKNQPYQKWNIENYKSHAQDILDPKDRVRLAERLLVDPLDETAHSIIAKRARRVTLITTITPIAALDILCVGAQNIAMMREIATLYGGRPSTFATFRLARMIITHLAIAGGLALSENFLHLFVGKGLLGRLSARFGEGAINGILTARIGLAACEVCRPIPKEESKREKLGSLLKELATFNDKTKQAS
jgi:putative membrane protein